MSPKDGDPVSGRRRFLQASFLTGVGAAVYPALAAGQEVTATPAALPESSTFELNEITIRELQDGMKSGRFTARSIAEQYLARIESMDRPDKDKSGNDRRQPAVNSLLELNPDAR